MSRLLLWLRRLSGVTLIVACTAPLPHSRSLNLLEQIQRLGEIQFVTANGPTTVYEGANGLTGFEYALMHRFADYLGVKATLSQPGNLQDIIFTLRQHPKAIGAAEIVINPGLNRHLDFGPTYVAVSNLVVTRVDAAPITSLDMLVGMRLLVRQGSTQEDFLRDLQKTTPKLSWQSVNGDPVQLLNRVNNAEADAAFIDRQLFEQNQVVFSQVKGAFELEAEQPIAWAFAKTSDKSLQTAVEAFFHSIKADGSLARLSHEYFYQPSLELDQNLRNFRDLMPKRLAPWRPTIEAAAEQYNLDWQVLAAIGYQESQWNAKAISETGVQGFMMLTNITAKAMEVNNRLNARDSIFGAARLMRYLLDQQSAFTLESDRLNLALAAYNLGLGHVQDAQALAVKAGKNPDSWDAVKPWLAKLDNKEIYSKTRHGYARGRGAVMYVEDIATYQELLNLYEQAASRMQVAQASHPAYTGSVPRQITGAIEALTPAL
ncbi:MAG: membrane-bound lytic murein transglycosylase MltF [Sphingobacteriales bacterium]|nr:MAG: membrane-bound lytic murein transglycosylase MltF [Sphingobacteriales bacterium]